MHIKPQKRLGQNFLIDKNIQRKILLASHLTNEDTVLEIGCGRGDLTVLLAQSAGQVFGLEVDRRLIPLLKQAVVSLDNCRIIQADILKFDLHKLVKENCINRKLKIVGNIPYYISSPIIEYLIGYRHLISQVFLTVQKEFGSRLAAKPGSKAYGSLSCFLQYYACPEIFFSIKKNSFYPAPQVDSSFLALSFREHPAVEVPDEVAFFKLIRTAFGQRRKTLRNSLEGLVRKEQLAGFLAQMGLDKNIRPEDLSLAQFARLGSLINSAA